jgi:hypothetical protein
MIEVREEPMRSIRRRPALGEAAMSVGAVAVLLAVLTGMDGRVREVLGFGGVARPGNEVAEAGGRIRDAVLVIFEVARDQSLDHAPLMIFALAATVLVLLMVRT